MCPQKIDVTKLERRMDFTDQEYQIIERALEILDARYAEKPVFASSRTVKTKLILEMHDYTRERFVAYFLDCQHQVIESETLFIGTVNAAAVYPREIVRRALQLNAVSLIIAHNHPSGIAEPSSQDRRITDRISKCLELVDITLIDHIVVGGNKAVSFAERGWL